MAFTGRAIYDTGVFRGVAEDVSPLIGMISPSETKFLNLLGDADRPAMSVLHEWLEDQLGPNTIVTSTAVGSTTAASSVTVSDGSAASISNQLSVGMVLIWPSGEYTQITAISGDDVTFSRAKGGTTATSYAGGDTVTVLSDVALEGSDVSDDVSRPRARRTNYCQIFKKDIIVSGTVQAVKQLGGISNEFDYQKGLRLKEVLRDLEKAVIRGKSFGNTLGSSSAYRTFAGVLAQITTNVTSAGSITAAVLDTAIKAAWNQGGFENGGGVIVCDGTFKAQIDTFNNSRLHVIQQDTLYQTEVTRYLNSFGDFQVHLNRWMPANSAMVISPERIKVLPLSGRSFQMTEVARVGDSERAMILGEFTVEVKNQEGLARIWSGVN